MSEGPAERGCEQAEDRGLRPFITTVPPERSGGSFKLMPAILSLTFLQLDLNGAHYWKCQEIELVELFTPFHLSVVSTRTTVWKC